MTEQYVPDEEQVRAWCREGTGDYPDVMDEWLDRFLARVRRDAAREALRNVEVQLAGELSAGTYLADWATLTARDVREGIWHVYDRIPEETL